MEVGDVIGDMVTVTVDRPLGSYHPVHKNIYYPINYGYIEGILAADGEPQDAYILGVNEAVNPKRFAAFLCLFLVTWESGAFPSTGSYREGRKVYECCPVAYQLFRTYPYSAVGGCRENRCV